MGVWQAAMERMRPAPPHADRVHAPHLLPSNRSVVEEILQLAGIRRRIIQLTIAHHVIDQRSILIPDHFNIAALGYGIQFIEGLALFRYAGSVI
jgi:hypothetical protein